MITLGSLCQESSRQKEKKKKIHILAGVIVSDHQEKIGLLLIIGTDKNTFGTQVICLGKGRWKGAPGIPHTNFYGK